jgi:hypothetical protein
MAITLAVSAGDNAVTNTELTVTSALAGSARAFLPLPGDGTGATAAEGATVEFVSSTAAGTIEVLDNRGFHVGFCPGKSTFVAVVRNGAWVKADVADAGVVPSSSMVANGTGATATGSKSPAAVATPATIAGWITRTLPNGTLAYFPYWQ